MGSDDAFLKSMGTKLWLELIPSSRAYAASPEFYEKQGTHVERNGGSEYSATTLGMMALLFVWSQTRRYKDKQFTGLAMLDAIFPLTLDNACDNKFARELDMRIERASQLKPCRHARYVWRHLASCYESWSFRNCNYRVSRWALGD